MPGMAMVLVSKLSGPVLFFTNGKYSVSKKLNCRLLICLLMFCRLSCHFLESFFLLRVFLVFDFFLQFVI